MAFERIKLQISEAVATLTFAHPSSLNAVSYLMLGEFAEALDTIEDPKSGVRCVVLTGEGRAFCSGMNLTEHAPKKSTAKSDAGAILESDIHPLLRRLRNLHCPLITSVNGPAAGVGMSFALMGDMVLAAKSAFFLQAFRKLGLVPDGGSTWILPRLIGVARSRELSLLGEKLSAETALEWGLINRVVDDANLHGQTVELAQQLAQGPTVALALTRQLYWSSLSSGHEEQLDRERQAQKQCGATCDFIEGVAAFREKRTAAFKGR